MTMRDEEADERFPCLCGHGKGRHYYAGEKECAVIDCGCKGYVDANDKIQVLPDPELTINLLCICGHLKISHQERITACQIYWCSCERYEPVKVAQNGAQGRSEASEKVSETPIPYSQRKVHWRPAETCVNCGEEIRFGICQKDDLRAWYHVENGSIACAGHGHFHNPGQMVPAAYPERGLYNG